MGVCAASAAGLALPPVPETRSGLLKFPPLGRGNLDIPIWSAACADKCNFNFHLHCKRVSL